MHTPGPWLIEDGDFVYALNNMGGNIFSCHIQGGFTNDGKRTSQAERSAIARLIAAAPELLKALKRITDQYKALLKDCGLSSKDAISSAEAAIAKAEGKP